MRAPALVVGPSLVAEYRTIVVPIVRSPESEDALIAAARLAADRGSTIVVLHVLELPLDRPLTADLGALEDRADVLLDDAQALLEEYGVRVVSRLVRARSTPRAIVDEAVGAKCRADRRRCAEDGSARSAAARTHRREGAQAEPGAGARDRRAAVAMMTKVLALLLVVLGVAIVVRTLAAGVGGGLGLFLGVLLVAAGAGRLYLLRRS